MTDTLRDKVAIVTGASRGIGAAIAERLASDGARVVVNYVRDSAAAESVVASICAAGNAAVAVQADISMPVEVERLTSAAMDRWGRLDIMVNNAGIGVFAPLEKVTEVDFQRLFATNVGGVLFGTQSAVRRFGESGGKVINISSGAAQSCPPGLSAYSATKAAVEALTRSYAAELGPRGITVNAIAPGLTETDMLAAGFTPELLAILVKNTPLRRLGLPVDIARVASFLASDEAGWITGQVIAAGGGLR